MIWLNHMTVLFLLFWRNFTQFSIVVAPIYTLANSAQDLVFSTSLPTLVISCLFAKCHSNSVRGAWWVTVPGVTRSWKWLSYKHRHTHTSVWFWFVFSWWLMMLSIFLCICWLSVCILWENVSSDSPYTFWLDFFVIDFYEFFMYFRY